MDGPFKISHFQDIPVYYVKEVKYFDGSINNSVSYFVHVLGVQSAAVNVICELARKNPKNYLSLAPLFFKLMNSSTNNWTLIKIIKLVIFIFVHC